MAELRNQDHSQAFYGQDTVLLSKASVRERKDPTQQASLEQHEATLRKALPGTANVPQRGAPPSGRCTRLAVDCPPAKQLGPKGTLLSSQECSLTKNTLVRTSSQLKKSHKAGPSAENLAEVETATTTSSPAQTPP